MTDLAFSTLIAETHALARAIYRRDEVNIANSLRILVARISHELEPYQSKEKNQLATLAFDKIFEAAAHLDQSAEITADLPQLEEREDTGPDN